LAANDSTRQGFNVRALIDRAGAIVERIAYDGYGQPHIRESCGRCDMDNSTTIIAGDETRFDLAKNTCSSGCIWDPRADLDAERARGGSVKGDFPNASETLFDAKRPTWDPVSIDFGPTVAQAFSDIDNPYLFQGVPHFALDTAANDTGGNLMLNHHRARYADPVAGRWASRDPMYYCRSSEWPTTNVLNLSFNGAGSEYIVTASLSALTTYNASDIELFQVCQSNPIRNHDPSGLGWTCMGCSGWTQVMIPPGWSPLNVQYGSNGRHCSVLWQGYSLFTRNCYCCGLPFTQCQDTGLGYSTDTSTWLSTGGNVIVLPGGQRGCDAPMPTAPAGQPNYPSYLQHQCPGHRNCCP
jgi:hypothetical protein